MNATLQPIAVKTFEHHDTDNNDVLSVEESKKFFSNFLLARMPLYEAHLTLTYTNIRNNTYRGFIMGGMDSQKDFESGTNEFLKKN